MTLPQMPLRQTASRAASWGLAEIVSRQGVQLLAMLLLARLLGPEEFALFALILIFTSVGSLLAESGMTSALVQRNGGTAGEREAAVFHAAAVGALLYGMIWWLAPAAADWLGTPELSWMLRVGGLAIFSAVIAVVPDAILIHKLDFKPRAKAEFSATVLAATLAVVVALRGGGAWSLVTLLVLAPLTRGLLVWVMAGWWPRQRPRLAEWGGLVAFGSNVMLASLLDTLVLRMQSLLLARLADLRELGYYSLAQNVHLAPATLSAQLLYRLALPLFARMAGDHTRLCSALDRMTRISTFIIAPPLLTLALSSVSFMRLTFGRQWSDAGPILEVLLIATALWPISVLNLTLLNALGRSDLFLRVEVVKKVLMIGCLSIGVRWGGIGLAWAVLVSVSLGTLLNMAVVGRLLGHGVRAQLAALGPTFATCSIAFTGGLWARSIGLGDIYSALMFLGLYTIMVVIMDRTSLRDLLLIRNDVITQGRGDTSAPGDR